MKIEPKKGGLELNDSVGNSTFVTNDHRSEEVSRPQPAEQNPPGSQLWRSDGSDEESRLLHGGGRS